MTGELVGDALDRFSAQSRRAQSRFIVSHTCGRHLLEPGQLSRRYRNCGWTQVTPRSLVVSEIIIYLTKLFDCFWLI